MVCNIGGQLGTKVVISALGMLALYMRFNGTGIWGGETIGHKDQIMADRIRKEGTEVKCETL